jgi:hypothetical protein
VHALSLKWLTLLLLVAATACVQVQSTTTSPIKYAPIEPNQVYVFQTEREVPGTYTSVGMIFTQAGSNFQNEGMQIDAAKKRAAKMGANGIILEGFTEPGGGTRIASAIFGIPSFRKGRVLAIHFDRGGP